ncbi:MAG: HEAT repeat domain-containing protein, partial [Bryobacterales bacterium]|nr:HEAT repeat domain-containing protein [Bryobacterales bacterium]
DGHVRSKAGLLMVRAHRNADWLQQQMMTADPRTLANLIEGLLETAPTEKEVHLLWTYTYHANHRVASTALLVLYRNGHQQAKERLLAMGNHPAEQFRTAAAWAMGQTDDLCFLETLQHMARNDSGNAKRMGLKGSVHLRKAAALATVALETAREPEGLEPAKPEAVAEATEGEAVVAEN